MDIAFLFIALVLAIVVFRIAAGLSWHWGVGVALGLIPIALTFFFGILGLLFSALFVGALYKASDKIR